MSNSRTTLAIDGRGLASGHVPSPLRKPKVRRCTRAGGSPRRWPSRAASVSRPPRLGSVRFPDGTGV